MSYEIVKNISVKNKSITSACNNLRPITYSTCKINAESEEKFVKIVLVEAYLGVFHLQNSKSLLPFRYALFKYKQLNSEAKEDIENKVWNSYNHKTKEFRYTTEERVEAIKKLGDILYGFYQSFKPTKGEYKIKYSSSAWIVKMMQTRFSYTWYEDKAKIYNTLEEAELIVDNINTNFSGEAKIMKVA